MVPRVPNSIPHGTRHDIKLMRRFQRVSLVGAAGMVPGEGHQEAALHLCAMPPRITDDDGETVSDEDDVQGRQTTGTQAKKIRSRE